jgi:TonB family protein
VRVQPGRIEIRGRRVFLNYNSRIKKFEEYPTNDSIRLEFARKPGVSAESVIDTVLLPLERLGASVPPYWTRFVQGETDPKPVVDPVTGAMVPRASESQGLVPRNIRQVNPQYPEALKPYGITGSVLMHVIVDEKGKPTVSDIMEPAGFGLEQAAIDAVQQWEYEPARSNGTPVKVYFRVRINFSPPR